MSGSDDASGFKKFDAQAKSDVFAKVFDAGQPMWEKLREKVSAASATPPKQILSVGDGPGEPGCYLASHFDCPTIVSDMVPPMVEAAKKRVEKKVTEGKLAAGQVECRVLDMQDLSSVESESVELVSSAHAYPFAPDQKKAVAEAYRVLKPGGVFGAVCWKSFELLPLAGALMGAVTGTGPPAPPPAGSPPPPPIAWADEAVVDTLLKEAGFEPVSNDADDVEIAQEDLVVAMKYSALPIWDKIIELETSGKVPDAWKKYEEAWPKICAEKGHLNPEVFTGFKVRGVYRTVVAKKPE